jgi:hypothetical protein
MTHYSQAYESFPTLVTRQKEGSGIAAFAILCIIVFSSVSPLRRWWYSLFLFVQ